MKRKQLLATMLLFGTVLYGCSARTEITSETQISEAYGLEITGSETYDSETYGSETSPLENEDISIVSVTMEMPSWDYYIAEETKSAAQPYRLTLLEESPNQITDTDEWFQKNALPTPFEKADEDGYSCKIGGDGYWVILYKSETPVAEIDFTSYLCPDPDLPESENSNLLQEIVRNAVVEHGVLYVSSFHCTYAASEPSNAYITAISLEDYHVLWRTAPLTCNSLNFEIVGDSIFCGYGFTAEPDILYQLDKKTGTVLTETPLKTMADYVIYKDEKLYVRTYDTDYIFQLD